MIYVFLVVLALLAAGGTLLLVRGTARGGNTATQPLDLAAFQQLVSPQDDAFLRRSLPASRYRALRRARVRAIREYLRLLAANAAALIAIGASATQDRAPATAVAARELISLAVRVRLLALLWIAWSWLAVLLPGVPLSPLPLLGDYGRLRQRLWDLSVVRSPATAGQWLARI